MIRSNQDGINQISMQNPIPSYSKYQSVHAARTTMGPYSVVGQGMGDDGLDEAKFEDLKDGLDVGPMLDAGSRKRKALILTSLNLDTYAIMVDNAGQVSRSGIQDAAALTIPTVSPDVQDRRAQ